ncbi:nucleotide sugar dehydrogenase [Exiguobacterium sp. s6]|uniref:nucleotide sugar dehydrogenase n=1 Tax=Exiguobacterium sp. s6 TaxID=2751236 RepID=UPI001BEB44B9|nr:nucleotide sugar dehydrogenase [Exiguobacterium sp. s6]
MELKETIGVIGLGYVGLPLAIEFAKFFDVVGYDTNHEKVASYLKQVDVTQEVGEQALLETAATLTTEEEMLAACTTYIVTVPTPINADKTPNLDPIIQATRKIAQVLEPGNLVIFESTVYPGTTEEICVPILEAGSGLVFQSDFKVGYSPERINPGDKVHKLTTIQKIVSGSDEQALERIDALYRTIIQAGTYRAPSIKVAEAAKVIENAQRDINIAFMNELSMVFDRMEIDTQEVLAAARTKWNFLPFQPGLVGGHCIGVDPYYFIYKAEQLGYHSQIISGGRAVNDSMGEFVTQRVIKNLIRQKRLSGAIRVGVLGVTFKENCSDVRNSKVFDIVSSLNDYGIEVIVHDPEANASDVELYYSQPLVSREKLRELDAIIIAVGHDVFRANYPLIELRTMLKPQANSIYDLKAIYSKEDGVDLGLEIWSL